MKKVLSLLIAVFYFCNFSNSQTYLGFEYNPDIPVKVGSTSLKNPWAGGINYGQFSTIDYNFDGLDDLVIFDRSGDEFVLMKHVVTGSVHEYNYVGDTYLPGQEDVLTGLGHGAVS